MNLSTSECLLPDFLNSFVQYKRQLWRLKSRDEINNEEIYEVYERNEMYQEVKYNASDKETFGQR